MKTQTSSPEAPAEEELPPTVLKAKAHSNDAISSLKRTLEEKSGPIVGIKLGKRRRSENSIDEQWENFLQEQNEEKPIDSSEPMKFGLSKRQKLNLAGE